MLCYWNKHTCISRCINRSVLSKAHSTINIHSVNMNIQDHLTQDRPTLKRKYGEDQSTQDKTPIKRKCEYLDVNIHKNMTEKRNGNFIIHDKVCTCCKRMTKGL